MPRTLICAVPLQTSMRELYYMDNFCRIARVPRQRHRCEVVLVLETVRRRHASQSAMPQCCSACKAGVIASPAYGPRTTATKMNMYRCAQHAYMHPTVLHRQHSGGVRRKAVVSCEVPGASPPAAPDVLHSSPYTRVAMRDFSSSNPKLEELSAIPLVSRRTAMHSGAFNRESDPYFAWYTLRAAKRVGLIPPSQVYRASEHDDRTPPLRDQCPMSRV